MSNKRDINWKQIAKDNNMTYHDFCEEVMNLASAYMNLECDKNNSNIMQFEIEDFGTLTYIKNKP